MFSDFRFNNSYILNKKIDFIDINIKKSNIFLPISQAFDTYGKVRIINFVHNNEEYISVLTTPVQPMALIEENLSIVYKTNINTALKFSKELNIMITKQVIDRNENIVEIYGILGNINISIPIELGNKKINSIEYIVIENNIEFNVEETLINLSYVENTVSIIQQYNKYKKLSRYISQYVLWLYSKYLKEFDIKEYDEVISPENMNNFKIKYIDIIDEYIYEEVPKTFSMDNNLIVDVSISLLKNLHDMILNDSPISFDIGEKSFKIPLSNLKIKREQYYYLKGKGISKIKKDIYDITDKSDIIVKFIIK